MTKSAPVYILPGSLFFSLVKHERRDFHCRPAHMHKTKRAPLGQQGGTEGATRVSDGVPRRGHAARRNPAADAHCIPLVIAAPVSVTGPAADRQFSKIINYTPNGNTYCRMCVLTIADRSVTLCLPLSNFGLTPFFLAHP